MTDFLRLRRSMRASQPKNVIVIMEAKGMDATIWCIRHFGPAKMEQMRPVLVEYLGPIDVLQEMAEADLWDEELVRLALKELGSYRRKRAEATHPIAASCGALGEHREVLLTRFSEDCHQAASQILADGENPNWGEVADALPWMAQKSAEATKAIQIIASSEEMIKLYDVVDEDDDWWETANGTALWKALQMARRARKARKAAKG